MCAGRGVGDRRAAHGKADGAGAASGDGGTLPDARASGSPIVYEIRGASVAIRRKDAEKITVRPEAPWD